MQDGGEHREAEDHHDRPGELLVAGDRHLVRHPLDEGAVTARRAVDEGLANNRGMATAGIILGWIAIALSVLLIVAGFAFVASGNWDYVLDSTRY